MKQMISYIKKLSPVFFVVLLWACDSNDEIIYDGTQVSQFAEDNQWIYTEPGKENATALEVWLLKPAEDSLNIPVRVVKNTRPASLFVKGATVAVGDIFYVPVRYGDLKGKVDITTALSYNNNSKFDTLVFEMVDPVFGVPGAVAHLRSQSEFRFRQFCPMQPEDIPSLIGSYTNLETVTPYTYRITSTIGDTLVIDGLANTLQAFTGITPIAGYPLKFVLDRSTKPITVTVAGNQPFFVTTVEGVEKTVWARAVAPSGEVYKGEINFCDKTLLVKIARYIPNESEQPGIWSIYMQKN